VSGTGLANIEPKVTTLAQRIAFPELFVHRDFTWSYVVAHLTLSEPREGGPREGLSFKSWLLTQLLANPVRGDPVRG
jgi:hypothetical protein